MLRLRSRDAARAVHELRAEEPLGAPRMRRLVELLTADLAGLPTSDEPAEVREARQGFEAACAWAAGIAADTEAAEQATREAAAADVAATADAMRAGKPRPKVTQLRRAEGITDAQVGCEAAEVLLMEAHERYVEAARETWPTWRASAAGAASSDHEAARRELAAGLARVASAGRRYLTAERLDSEILARFPEVRVKVEAETVHGLPWYLATHSGRRPLRTMAIPGLKDKGKPVPFDLPTVLAALLAAVEAEAEFPAAAWLPPGDPEREAVMAAPLDLSAGWVRSAVSRAQGVCGCVLCQRQAPLAELVVAQDASRDGAGLELVHPACARKFTEGAQARRLSARAARYQRSGFPPPPDAEPAE